MSNWARVWWMSEQLNEWMKVNEQLSVWVNEHAIEKVNEWANEEAIEGADEWVNEQTFKWMNVNEQVNEEPIKQGDECEWERSWATYSSREASPIFTTGFFKRDKKIKQSFEASLGLVHEWLMYGHTRQWANEWASNWVTHVINVINKPVIIAKHDRGCFDDEWVQVNTHWSKWKCEWNLHRCWISLVYS